MQNLLKKTNPNSIHLQLHLISSNKILQGRLIGKLKLPLATRQGTSQMDNSFILKLHRC